MLPLKERRKIRNTTANTLHVSGNSSIPSCSGVDTASIIQALTATLAAEMAKYKLEVNSTIHNEVQTATAEALSMMSNLKPTSHYSTTLDQPTSQHHSFVPISTQDDIMDA